VKQSIYSIKFIPESADELQDSALWYEDQKRGLGSNFMLSIEATLDSIQRNPFLFPIVRNQTRRAVVKRFPYSVFYQIDHDVIIVLAVFHMSRDPEILTTRF
jgi:toxin ParE1/3/4